MSRTRAYASNIAAAWPIERQAELLAGRGELYRDVLPRREIKQRRPVALVERADMLRPTARRTSETIHVASLVCLAWDAVDLMDVFAKAAARHATVVALDTGQEIPPTGDVSVYKDAVEAFAAGKRRARTAAGRERGWKVAAENKRKETEVRLKLIADDWGKPEREVGTKELLVRAGRGGRPMAYTTAIRYLGSRLKAQRAYAAKLEAQGRSRRRGEAAAVATTKEEDRGE